MKNIIKGLFGAVFVVALLLVEPFVDGFATDRQLGVLLGLLLFAFAYAGVSLWVGYYRTRKSTWIEVRDVRHLGPNGWCLYTVKVDGTGEVREYELQKEKVHGFHEELSLRCLYRESISLEEAQAFAKE